MGFLGGVFDHGHALCPNGSQHNIHSSAYGDHIQVDLSAGQTAKPRDLGAHQAAAHIYFGPHSHKALNVLVDGPRAQIAAAGQRHLGPAEAAQQSAHQIIAGADLAGQLVRHLTVADIGAVDVHGGAVDGAHIRPQIPKDLEDPRDIADLGNILDTADALYQQGSGKNCHRGIFGAADLNGAVEGTATANLIFIQAKHLPYKGYQ